MILKWYFDMFYCVMYSKVGFLLWKILRNFLNFNRFFFFCLSVFVLSNHFCDSASFPCSKLRHFFPRSCFLLSMKDDSIEGIYDTLKQCALISKSAGGIGVAVSCIRATGSYIAGVSFCHLAFKRGFKSKSNQIYGWEGICYFLGVLGLC